MNYFSKIMIILAVGGLVLPIHSIYLGSALSNVEVPYFSFAQQSPGLGLTPPQSMEEAKAIGIRALGFLPQTLQEVWQGFLGYCLTLVNIFVKIWNNYIFPYLKKVWESSLKQELEKRIPGIKQEYQTEKTEMTQDVKTEVPKVTKTLWEKFKELIK